MAARVTGQLVGSGEALSATEELAGVRLLASMGADVSGLMLKTVKGLVAQRAFVRPGQIWTILAVPASDHGGHHADGCYLCVPLALLDLAQLVGLDGGLGVQWTGEI